MIAAIAVVAAAQAASSIAQYYQSEKARKASQERLEEIKALFDAIKTPEYNVSVLDPPEYIRDSVPEAAFDLSKLTPENYAVAAKYMPEVASFIAEKNPEVVKLTAQGEAGKAAQVQALKDIKQRTGELADAESESAASKAFQTAQSQAQSRSDSILQDANRRGQLGSGASLAAQLQGSSDAMSNAANTSNNAYLEALRTKMGALRDSGDMGRQLAQDDMNLQSTNAGIINSYNQRAAANMNSYMQNAANTRNEGQKYNVQNLQDISNKNVSQSNQYDQMNRQRQDAILEYLQKSRTAERDYQNNAAQNTYNNRANEINRNNALKTQQFNNEMSKASASAGVGYQQVNNIMQSAQDRNQMYQGAANTVASVAGAYGNNQAADERQKREMDAKYGRS